MIKKSSIVYLIDHPFICFFIYFMIFAFLSFDLDLHLNICLCATSFIKLKIKGSSCLWVALCLPDWITSSHTCKHRSLIPSQKTNATLFLGIKWLTPTLTGHKGHYRRTR